MAVGPDFGGVGFGEAAFVVADGVAVGDFVDGGGGPFGPEDDGAFEQFVVLEVEADAEVVEVAAEEQHLLLCR